jgi:hypothetical protein
MENEMDFYEEMKRLTRATTSILANMITKEIKRQTEAGETGFYKLHDLTTLYDTFLRILDQSLRIIDGFPF